MMVFAQLWSDEYSRRWLERRAAEKAERYVGPDNELYQAAIEGLVEVPFMSWNDELDAIAQAAD